MRRRLAIGCLAIALGTTACGVSMQDAPETLPSSSTAAEQTPTTTQRPDTSTASRPARQSPRPPADATPLPPPPTSATTRRP